MFTAAVILPWIIPGIVVALALYLGPEIEKFLQVKADDSRREYVREAIMNGIMVAKINNPVALDDYFVKSTIEYVKKTCPDALKELKLKDPALEALVKANLLMFGTESSLNDDLL